MAKYLTSNDVLLAITHESFYCIIEEGALMPKDEIEFEIIIQQIEQNTCPPELSLDKKDLEVAQGIRIGHALEGNHTLQCLNLSNNFVRDEGTKALAKGLGINKALRTLNLQNNQVNTIGVSDLAKGLEINSTLQSLNLDNNKAYSEGAEIMGKALQKNQALLSLSLKNNGLGDAGAEELAKALSTNRTLQSIILSDNELSAIGAEAIAKALKVNQTLQILELGGSGLFMGMGKNQIGDVGIQALGKALELNRGLQNIGLYGNDVSEVGGETLGKALIQNSTLRSLDLGSNNLGAKGTEALAKALTQNSTLQSLSLSGNNLGLKGVEVLATALKDNRSLQSLKVSKNKDSISKPQIPYINMLRDTHFFPNNYAKLHLEYRIEAEISYIKSHDPSLKVGDIGSAALAKALEINSSLQVLEIRDNEIGEIGAIALAKALETNSSLQALDMGDNAIGDTGAIALAKALEKNSSLRTLVMGDNDIGDAGAVALAKALEINHTLQSLEIIGLSKIGEIGAIALANALEKNYTLFSLNFFDYQMSNIGKEALDRIKQYLDRNKQLGKKYLEQPFAEFFAEMQSLALLKPDALLKLGRENYVRQYKHCEQQIIQHLKERNTGGLKSKPEESELSQLIEECNKKCDMFNRMSPSQDNSAIDAEEKEREENQQFSSQHFNVESFTGNDLLQALEIEQAKQRTSTLKKQDGTNDTPNLAIDLFIQAVRKIKNEAIELDAVRAQEIQIKSLQVQEQLQVEITDRLKQCTALEIQQKAQEQQIINLKIALTHINEEKEQQKIRAQLKQLTGQLDKVKSQLDVLWSEHKLKAQKQAALLKFQTHPNLILCYRMLLIKLEELFIGFKTVASGFVNPAAGNTATAATIVSCLGDMAGMIPVVGATIDKVCQWGSKGLVKVDLQRQKNTAINASGLVTLAEVQQYAESVARQLTERYAEQLILLATPEEAQNLDNKLQLGVKKVKEKVLKAKSLPPAKQFATFAIMAIADKLYTMDEKEVKEGHELDSILVSHITEHKPVQRVQELWSIVTSKVGVQSNIYNKQGKAWQAVDVYMQPGIKVEKPDGTGYQYYLGAAVQPKTFGWRIGTKETASALQLILVATPSRESNPFHVKRVMRNVLAVKEDVRAHAEQIERLQKTYTVAGDGQRFQRVEKQLEQAEQEKQELARRLEQLEKDREMEQQERAREKKEKEETAKRLEQMEKMLLALSPKGSGAADSSEPVKVLQFSGNSKSTEKSQSRPPKSPVVKSVNSP